MILTPVPKMAHTIGEARDRLCIRWGIAMPKVVRKVLVRLAVLLSFGWGYLTAA